LIFEFYILEIILKQIIYKKYHILILLLVITNINVLSTSIMRISKIKSIEFCNTIMNITLCILMLLMHLIDVRLA